MVCLTDVAERQQRRAEYSAILRRVSRSEVFNHADSQPELEFLLEANPKEARQYPALILEWQLLEGILGPPGVKKRRCLVEWRSEYAKQLATFVVARQVEISVDSLSKRCRSTASRGSTATPINDDHL